MHDTEQAFLHFPSILGAKDDHFPPRKIEVYASGGSHVVGVTVTRELPGIVDCEVRSTKFQQLFRSRADAPVTCQQVICLSSYRQENQPHYLHVMHKEGVVSSCGYNPNFDSVFRIPV